jgi:manganese transport protein
MVPSFVVVAMGANPTQALVLSQVVLSFALPIPMIALLLLTRRRDIMGSYADGPFAVAMGSGAAGIVLILNLLLLLQLAGVALPFLSAMG